MHDAHNVPASVYERRILGTLQPERKRAEEMVSAKQSFNPCSPPLSLSVRAHASGESRNSGRVGLSGQEGASSEVLDYARDLRKPIFKGSPKESSPARQRLPHKSTPLMAAPIKS